MCKEVKKGSWELFVVRLSNIEESVVSAANCAADIREVVREFVNVFKEELPDELLQPRRVEFEINVIPAAKLPVRPVIRLSPWELQELKRRVQKYLKMDF